MVYESNSAVVVMLTRLQESGAMKKVCVLTRINNLMTGLLVWQLQYISLDAAT